MGPLFYVINTFNLKERFFSKFFTSHFNCVKCIFFEFLNEGGRKEMRKIVLSVMVVAFYLALASNSFAKSADGFTLLIPSIISGVTIILCMYALSNVMKTLPIGATYASFAGLTIIATSTVGIIKFSQIPNIYTIIGLLLIIVGVLMVNLLGGINS